MNKLLDFNENTISINIDNCKILGKGYHSSVYKLDDERVAKIYNRSEDIDMAIHERIVAKKAFVKGVPTEISFGMCECDGKPGLIYELVNSDTLLSILKKDDNNIEKYIVEYVELINKLHSVDILGFEDFGKIKTLYMKNIEKLKLYLDKNELQKLYFILNSIEDQDKLLHGDPHPGNVMTLGKNLIFIDLSDMKIGNEIFDLVYLYRTLILFEECDKKMAYDLKTESCINLWRRFFNEYYKSYDDSYRNAMKNKIRILGLLSITAYFVDRKNKELINTGLCKLKESIKEVCLYGN